jgi:Ca-activated chloride channel family protein
MKMNRDDPKWTAYVLGELSHEDRAAMEQLLQTDEEAQAFVEELRLATTMLKEELAQVPSMALGPEQRDAVWRVAAGQRKAWFMLRPATWAVGLVAAGLIVAAVILPSLLSSRAPASDVLPFITRALPPPGSPPPTQNPSTDTSSLATVGQAPRANIVERPGDREQREVASPPAGAPSGDGAEKLASELKDDRDGIRSRNEGAVAPSSPPPAAPPAAGPGPAANFSSVLGGALQQQEAAAPPLLPRIAAAVPAPFPLDRPSRPTFNTEAYDRVTDNPFIRVSEDPLATFSIDVDTASYANVRRFLTQNQLPPKDAVRIEELVNYFSYDYPQPSGQHPIAAHMEVASAPWHPQHRLVRIGIKGRDIDVNRRPSSNLVFLIDVSGSMQPPEKLPLLKSAMKLLVDQLTENDRVSIVVYAGASGMVLPPTTGNRKGVILRALESLQPGGSTNGASGIQLAYDLAVSHFIRGGVNRVVLATDGDFNVGITNQGDLTRLIEDKARSGVFLSVLGFGMGNLKDSTLEKLADTGNGNYAYIDSLNEARKVLVEEMGGTLVTIAKDVKIQIEFNPTHVSAYRLIGYENRLLRNEDFNNDLKDAGDMGSGHTVTALFEVVPPGVEVPIPDVDPLKYRGAPSQPAPRASSREMLNLKVRYKDPDGSQSKLLEVPLVDRGDSFSRASRDFQFAASVAAFGMILRGSPYKGNASFNTVLETAEQSTGADRNGYRGEFVELVKRARALGTRD